MLLHYWVMAIRQLLKHKIHSLVKILGLALGLAGALLVVIVNYSETSWDGFWQDADQIYKFESYDGSKALSGFTPAILAETVRELVPGITAAGRLQRSMILVQFPNQETQAMESFEQSVTRIDDSILDIFLFSERKGNLDNFRNNPTSAIISEATAKKYFGDTDPIGKQFLISASQLEGPAAASQETPDEQKLYTIVAVIADVSMRSNERYQVIIPFNARQRDIDGNWISRSLSSYIKVNNQTQLDDIEFRLNQFVKNQHAEQKVGSNVDINFKLIALQKLHTQGAEVNGGTQQLILLYVLGFLALFITLVNHINLSFSGYLQRTKEVGLRRLVGAQQGQLFVQIWIESLLYLLLAGLLAFILLEPVLPFISSSLHIRLEKGLLLEPWLLVAIAGLFLFASLVIAGYPVVRVTRSSLAVALRANRARETVVDTRLRKLFYLLQLMASSLLLVSVVIVNAQLDKFSNFDPGYDTDSIYFFHGQQFLNANRGQFAQLKTRLEANPAIQGVARTRRGLLGSRTESGLVSTMDQDKAHAIQIALENVPDFNALRMFQVPLLAGELPQNGDKFLTGSLGTPANGLGANELVICEAVLPLLGFTNAQDALHQTIKLYMGDFGIPMKIIAVTGKFHFGEFYSASSPCVFWQVQFGNAMSWGINFKGAEFPQVETYIKQVWKDVMGGTPNVMSLRDMVEASVGREKTLQTFLHLIAVITVVISLLGLYGLVQLSLQKRQLELALRKLHGASPMQILKLLTREFAALTLLANLIALPIAVYVARYWLENFYQPINLWWWIPVAALVSVGLTLVLTQASVSLQAIAIARKRPALALAHE